ncbi:MAG TPA: DUF4132 domain-containing protein, partial [Ktedonobacterales bacterium]|nr:DUF4132 domain-containing protein [Ktedonobacterales bacterium]
EKRCWIATSVVAKALNGLATIGSDAALNALADLSVITPSPDMRERARELFAEAAAQRNLSPADLADAIVPTFGFDARSERTFDYGPRRFVARLGVGGALTLTELREGAAPKRVASLPQPTTRDDVALGAAAHAEWPTLKAQAKAAAALQARRLEDALLTRRTWDVARWRASFQRHPLLRPAATTLVWGLLADGADANGASPYACVFRPLGDGSLTDADDAPVTLPATGAIQLVHPAELAESAHAQWRRQLADSEVKQVFTQLDRSVVRLRDDERGAQWWTGLVGQQFNARQEQRALESDTWRRTKAYNPAEWQTHPLNEDGYYGPRDFYGCYRRLHPWLDGWALLRVTYLNSERRDIDLWEWRVILGLGFARGPTVQDDARYIPATPGGPIVTHSFMDDDLRLLPLSEVSPVALSELVGELQRIVARGRYDPDWRDKVF